MWHPSWTARLRHLRSHISAGQNTAVATIIRVNSTMLSIDLPGNWAALGIGGRCGLVDATRQFRARGRYYRRIAYQEQTRQNRHTHSHESSFKIFTPPMPRTTTVSVVSEVSDILLCSFPLFLFLFIFLNREAYKPGGGAGKGHSEISLTSLTSLTGGSGFVGLPGLIVADVLLFAGRGGCLSGRCI